MEFLILIVVLVVLAPLVAVAFSLFSSKKTRAETHEHYRNKRLVREAEVQRAKRELGE